MYAPVPLRIRKLRQRIERQIHHDGGLVGVVTGECADGKQSDAEKRQKGSTDTHTSSLMDYREPPLQTLQASALLAIVDVERQRLQLFHEILTTRVRGLDLDIDLDQLGCEPPILDEGFLEPGACRLIETCR
jgi:hypothetical protein